MYEYIARVINIYDGDTITAKIDLGFYLDITVKFRIYGINTPEVRGKERIRGKEVRDHVRELLLDKKVFVRTEKQGKFGRYIGDVWFNLNDEIGYKTNLTEYLLENGMGIEFMKDKH